MKQHFLNIFLLFFCSLSFAQSLTDSLKAYWSFDGNTLDISGYGHHATPFGTTPVTDRLGNANSAYYFNGNTDYMTFPTSSAMRPSLPASISVWIKCAAPPAGPGGDIIIATEHNLSNGFYSGFWAATLPYSGAIQINFGDNTGACGPAFRRTITGNTNVCNGQWHLLTFVVTSASNMQLYIDCQAESGSYSGSGAINPVYTSVPTGIIGNMLCSLAGNDGHFEGMIDELRFYNRALSALDVANLYNYPNASSPNLAAGILGNDTSFCAGSLLLNANTSWGTSYTWSNGSTSPTISVNASGTYWVNITGNACGQSGSDTIVISTSNVQANLFPDTVLCKNQLIILDAGTGYSSYSWNTGATSQTISVTQPGSYIVQATNSNGCGVMDTIQVTNYPTNPPAANFTYTFLPFGMVQLNNTSLYSSQYQWTYSNGGVDYTFSPQHLFPCNVPITVTLISSGRCGADTAIQTITYGCDAIEDITQKIDLQTFPNPVKSVLMVDYELESPQKAKLLIYNTLGQIVYEQPEKLQVGKIHSEIAVDKWASSVYFLQIVTEKGTAAKKIWVEK